MKKDKNGFWNFWDNIQGDRVILIAAILLIMFSIVCIFSSTTLLAKSGHSRMDIFWEQMFIVFLGSATMAGLYFIPKIGVFRFLSQFGFVVSLVFLLMLWTPLGQTINGARRSFRFLGFSIQSYEIVKVAMVMYLSWAVYTYKHGEFWIVNKLRFFSFLQKPVWQRIIYMYLEIGIVVGLILHGSLSSAMFIGGIMLLTIIIGGGTTVKDMVVITAAGLMIMGGCLSLHFASNGKIFPRAKTWISRSLEFVGIGETSKLDDYRPGTVEYQEIIDKMRQREGATIAIHEGGLTGKGAGKSTQKNVVPLMFSDFMFSFIIEEYGSIVAIILIIIYVGLLARGSLIARSIDNEFAKTAVAGLTLMISGQAMMHMYINAGIGPLTGQTLPMISHGNTSFLAFSVAFGILLSISKMAKKKLEMEARLKGPLIVKDEDDIKARMDDLDMLDSIDEYDSNGIQDRETGEYESIEDRDKQENRL